MKQTKLLIILFTVISFSQLLAQDLFVRSAEITPPGTYASGFGATVSGVDLDGDGKLEIYSVDGMTDFMTGDEIPQIIKYERNGTAWDSVWAASFPNENQNTWAALTIGDLDGDGKQEIIWGFTNNFAVNTTPPRIVVFEADGDDVLGISDGAGNYDPNAQWDFDLAPSTNIRPLKWYAYDINGDGAQEIVFADRQGTLNMGVVSVDDIPDAGGGTEIWSLDMTKDTELLNRFTRSAVIDGPQGGFGGVVTDVDYDEDGLMDLYAVNDDWIDTPTELTPTLFKYELVSGAWILRWSTVIPDISHQNTWPVLVGGDWDGDGKGEVIWAPINNFGTGNEDPDRIVVYETPGDGSDEMGIDLGDGTWAPNAGWNMDVPASTSMRPFRGYMVDIDNDGALEFVFAERHNYYVWGVVGVDDIPDAGDGSETWTMEANGVPDAGSDYRDLAVIDQVMYLFDGSSGVRTITNDGTDYTVSSSKKPWQGWSWLSATATDIDGDGNMEIVTGDYTLGGNGSVWVLVPDADSLVGYMVADLSANTASRLTGLRVGDINADGLADFIVGNNGTDEIHRIAYNGGDITLSSSYTTSLLDAGVLGIASGGQMDLITLANLDAKGGDEVIYGGIPRGVAANTQPLTIGSYSDLLKLDAGARWDIAVANNAIHLFDGSGNIQRVDYANDQWNIYPSQPAVVNGAFLTASTTDIEGDGIDEIMVGNWNDAKVNMLKWINGAWVATVVADFTADGGTRLNGGAVGDIDGDGNIDFVTGSRASVPNGQIYRVEYTGGDVMDAGNWKGEVIDYGYDDKFTQFEVINIANLDEDDDLEVLYTSDYARGPNTGDDAPFPIIILDLIAVQTETIAAVKVDEAGDFMPDRLDEVVTVKGVVTTPDYGGYYLNIYIQDETAGINIYSQAYPDAMPEVGQLLQITGTVAQYNGLTELILADANADIVLLGSGTVPEPVLLDTLQTPEQLEALEGSLILIRYFEKAEGSDDWPAEGSSANILITDSYTETLMRIDSDTEIDGQPEPVYPMNVAGVLTQYSTAVPPNDGYQIMPRYYDDIDQDVAAPPHPYFPFTEETRSMYSEQTIAVNTNEDTFDFSWLAAVDLNDDALIYQFVTIVDGVESYHGGTADTSITLTGADFVSLLNGATDNTVTLTIRTTDTNTPIVYSADKIWSIFDILVSIDEELIIPKEFFVDQNYPNPFNPSTTIKFGLPQEANVDLRVYDILGREVTVLINQEMKSAGTYNYQFDASQLASGTYIYRLQANDKTQIKKMLLLK